MTEFSSLTDFKEAITYHLRKDSMTLWRKSKSKISISILHFPKNMWQHTLNCKVTKGKECLRNYFCPSGQITHSIFCIVSILIIEINWHYILYFSVIHSIKQNRFGSKCSSPECLKGTVTTFLPNQFMLFSNSNKFQMTAYAYKLQIKTLYALLLKRFIKQLILTDCIFFSFFFSASLIILLLSFPQMCFVPKGWTVITVKFSINIIS